MNKVSFSAQICIFVAAMIIGLIAVSACSSIISTFEISDRTRGLTIATLQNLIVFCLPSFIVAVFGKFNIFTTLSLNKVPSLKAFVGVIVVFTLGLPLLNQLVYWNDSVSLPQFMHDLEESLRSMEETARNATAVFLSDLSIYGLIINVLIIGILTGFSEEIFFRAGLQRLLGMAMSKHWAIWLAAYIFTSLHFQFFGFIPRLLMGAFFGYLYYWTGSIWVSIFAHALNNSIVVIIEWLVNRDMISFNVEEFGVTRYGFPIYAVVSLLLLAAFLYYRSYWFKRVNAKEKSEIKNVDV